MPLQMSMATLLGSVPAVSGEHTGMWRRIDASLVITLSIIVQLVLLSTDVSNVRMDGSLITSSLNARNLLSIVIRLQTTMPTTDMSMFVLSASLAITLMELSAVNV